MTSFKRALLMCANIGLALSLAPAALALDAPEPEAPPRTDIIVVTGEAAVQQNQPATVETKSAEEIHETTSVINAEDALRYFPNILVRKRHVGDTQAPITTRTSGVGSSARSLIYADGVLLSALIGNNNSTASPKWGMVNPDSISSVSVLYGPFSAAYAGNSIGAVVEIETRMPDKLEGLASLVGSSDHFHEYATSDDFGAVQGGLTLGDRIGPFSFWFGATRTESDSQPVTYATATRPTCAPPATTTGCLVGTETALSGAVSTFNRTGAPIVVLGEGGLEHQVQDNETLKLAWDFTPQTTLAYTVGRFGNDTDSSANSYLRDASGNAVYAGGPFNINGFRYSSIAASAFSNGVYAFDETQWMQSLSLIHNAGENFDWRIVASTYDYDKSQQRMPSVALPTATSGGAGSIADMSGTGWTTLDAKGIWRPTGPDGAHEVSFGLHGDRYELDNNRSNTANWISGAPTALASAARGQTETYALWAQEAWRFAPAFKLTVGGRWEEWRAFKGYNFSATPALSVQQPSLNADRFSPKAALEWDFAPGWLARVSAGEAFRFPTVTELYQSITTGTVLTVPNPNLKPEDAKSTDWTVERRFEDGSIRASFFTEDIDDALLSQSAPLVAGSTTLFNYVQNIGHARSRGLEVSADKDNVLIHGLSLSGSVTYVDSQTTKDPAFPAAVGRQTPNIPKWRSTLVAAYRPDLHWTFTLAGRYVDAFYSTLDNTDTFSHTYQGFEGFMTWDARVNYRFDQHWSAAVGLENFGGANYFLFHPFPQRTATAELKYNF
ncbi:MAG: TonB-dependent receptor [Alphaproteobacteria bacterium]